jgi:hypothetical protein
LNIKKIRDIVINNWKHLEIFMLILKIKRNWVQNPNFIIFIFYKKENQKIIKILNNFLIKKNDFINNLNLDSNKSGDDFVFELNINPSPMLYFIVNKFIIINNSFKKEDLPSSKFPVIDSIDQKNKSKDR